MTRAEPFVVATVLLGAGCTLGLLGYTGVGTSAGVTASTSDARDTTPDTLGDELQLGAEFYKEISAEFRATRERAATEVLTYADFPEYCRDFASVAQAFHDAMVDHPWPASAAESAGMVVDDLRVLASLLERCSRLPGEEDAFYNLEGELSWEFDQFDMHDVWLQEDLGIVQAGDASTPEQTAAFYAEFAESANAALAELGADYVNLGSNPWPRLPAYCAAAVPLFADFADQLEDHFWTRELAPELGPELVERSGALSELLSECAEQPGTPDALGQLDVDIGIALASYAVYSNAVRDVLGMKPVARRTPSGSSLRVHLAVGIAPW